MNRPRVDLHRDVVGDIRTGSSVVVAVAVGADSVPTAKVDLVAIARIFNDHGVSRCRLRDAGRGVSDRGDEKHGGDQGHRQYQSCPCRNWPRHRVVDTFIRAIKQSVTVFGGCDCFE